MLCRYAGLTQRATAVELSLSSGTTIGQQLALMISENRRLKKQVAGIYFSWKKTPGRKCRV